MAQFETKENPGDLESSLQGSTKEVTETQVTPVLAKSFNLLSACATGITTGNAWAVLGGGIIASLYNGGPPGVIYEFATASFFYCFIAASIAELASAIPASGGVYHWATITAGPRYGRLCGWFAGWLNGLAWTFAVAGNCSMTGSMIVYSYTLYHPEVKPQRWHVFVCYLIITWLCCLTVMFCQRALAVISRIGSFFIIVGFVISVLVCAIMPSRDGAGYASNEFVWTDWNNITGYSDGFTFLAGMLNGAFAIGAIDCVTHIAEEIPDARRNIPKALACQVTIGFATGLCYLISIFYAVTDLSLIVNADSISPLGDIYLQATGSRAGAVGLLTLTIVPIFIATIGCYITAGRTFYVLGRDNATPFSKHIGAISPKWHSPLQTDTMGGPVTAPRKQTKRIRQAKQKSVTFTGCWTCRSRKVKCDERQENGCRVCQKSRLECAGYGVNLCWITDKKRDIQGLRRRQVRLEQSTSPSISDAEINRMISSLDTISTPSRTVSIGPFSIFSSREPGIEYLEPHASLENSHQTQDCTSEIAPSPVDTVDLSSGDFEIITNDNVIPNSEIHFIDFPSDWESVIAMMDTSNSPTLPYSRKMSLTIYPSPDMELSIPLFKDHNTSMLMYHYKNHVAELLQPVFHPRNPWRTTYLPFALEGCPEFCLVQNPVPSSEVSISLFHSILSSAAFHLRNIMGGSREYHKLGLQHRAKALQALKTALITPNDSEKYTVYLTAMLALVTIDTMTGEDSDFPIHLKGCRQLERPGRASDSPNDSSRQVSSICHFLSLLARTTAHELEHRQWTTEGPLFEQPYFHDDDTNIQYMYGITPYLGNLLQRTCQVAEYLAFYQGAEVPTILLEACSALKDEIFSWDIDSESFHHVMLEQPTMLEIIRCQALSFHSAIAIFYYRAIEDSSPVDLQQQVGAIWKNLSLAEDLKDVYSSDGKRAAPMSWPAFIAACEAIDRQPWVEWWERVQRYSMGNFKRQWKVIQEIWNIMDLDENVLNWRDALKQSGKLVLPI
ncbi:transcriptional regulator family: Fungal Specific TF [Penicillium roqueforti]|nr:transcriptional regulator family: Fungal Specific TF [Penicillium roqueforti]KAI2705705.1 transcriptional regulator family: Fungal Specific TF [Penicillium roqueforti]KAI2718812.1 transcriptional regulator family: Fungal Specific TF [Penicillium roqueforti]KAI2727596.1 transcriptional regulator family: Fungal Specific TF [Penicillium roqueforti]KAI2745690.1 transcriptional regulator family: Fungal Specific TF [Penicillium roqueforti]